MRGDYLNRNLSVKSREGWEPCEDALPGALCSVVYHEQNVSFRGRRLELGREPAV